MNQDKAETIIKIMSIVFSGQLILAIWQVIKEILDRKRAKKDAEEKSRSGIVLIEDMLKRVFRTTLKNQLQQIFIELDNIDKYPKSQILLDLTELKDNMELYLKMGGNGAVHRLYATLLDRLLHDPDLVSYIDAVWIETIGSEIQKEV